MNCKKGDMAILVRTKYRPELIGRVYRCVRLHLDERIDADGVPFSEVGTKGPRWVVKPQPAPNLKTLADANLRPIRDNDGKDETLTWAGKPEQITAEDPVPPSVGRRGVLQSIARGASGGQKALPAPKGQAVALVRQGREVAK